VKKISWLFGISALLVIGVFLFSSSFVLAQVTGKSVKIGIMVPITASSGADSKGQVLAAEIARDEINAAGGIGGVPLELVVYDTRADVKEDIIIFKKLALVDKVLSVMGPGYSTECEVVFPLANELKLVSAAPASAKPGLTAKNRPWAFRDSGIADRKLAPAFKKWIEMYKIKKVYMVYDAKDALAKSEMNDIFPAFLKADGGESLGVLTYMTGDMDFSALVTKVKETKPDGVVISSGPTEMANFVREMRRQGMKQPVFGGAEAYQIDLMRIGGKDVEGMMTGGHVWIGRADPRMQAFVKNYEERGKTALPKEIAGTPPDTNQVAMYDGIYINKKAMDEYKITNRPEDLEKDRDKIRQGWQNLKNYNAIMGVISMGTDGDIIGKNYIIQVKGGRFVAIE
jgi:branched-chain amino acid transport system substrate-binding protein